MMRVHYDHEADFLEIAIGQPTKCDANEVEPGIFVRTNDAGTIQSVGILNFKNRSDITLPIDVTMMTQ